MAVILTNVSPLKPPQFRPALQDSSGLPILWASAHRISIPTFAAPFSAFLLPTHAATSFEPSWKASLSA